MTAPAADARRAALSARSAGRTRARRIAGNAASSPNLSVSPSAVPARAPARTLTFHARNRPMPDIQNAALRALPSSWASTKAAVSSVMRCAPISRAAQERPRSSARARLNAAVRELRSSPVTAAATGPPPAVSSPTALNWAEPAYTSSDMRTGTQRGSPPATAIAPKETPTTASASQTRAMSRRTPRGRSERRTSEAPGARIVLFGGSFVRFDERMHRRMDSTGRVRQGERMALCSERCAKRSVSIRSESDEQRHRPR